MTIQQLQTTAPPLAGLVLALALLFILGALRQFRKSRTDSYWRRRRESGQRGWRLLVTSLFLMLTSGMVCSISGVAGLILRAQITPTVVAVLPTRTAPPTLTATLFVPTSAPLATDPPTETHTPPPTVTLLPTLTQTPHDTATALSTNTRQPTLTAPPTLTASTTPVTPTQTIKAAAALVVPSLQSSVTPSSNARLTITALDYQISGSLGPVSPSTVFAPGFNRLYYFVTFANMQSGVVWRGVLIQNGNIIQRYERLWGTAQNGSGYFFFGQENGFQPGSYEIWLYLGDSPNPIAQAAFRVEAK